MDIRRERERRRVMPGPHLDHLFRGQPAVDGPSGHSGRRFASQPIWVAARGRVLAQTACRDPRGPVSRGHWPRPARASSVGSGPVALQRPGVRLAAWPCCVAAPVARTVAPKPQLVEWLELRLGRDHGCSLALLDMQPGRRLNRHELVLH
jgi:hypothetical protein